MSNDTASIRTQRTARARGWWVTSAALAVVLLVCVAIVWAGAIHDPDGNSLLADPGAVLLGLFALVGTLGSALIAKLAPSLKVIEENVQNDHKKPDGSPLNMRDDLDEKHDVVIDTLRDLRRDIGGIREEIRNDRRATADRFDGIDDRLQKIDERTR
ncbi:hypothetical protein [Microbacterium sp.]|uniref:hypothetical protein n=1 Tax=Microbacterium sp. TaxID=51671 RepID=UPI003A8D8380